MKSSPQNTNDGSKERYRHPRDKNGSCSEFGAKAEDLFKEAMEALGKTVEPTKKGLQVKHVDFIVDGKHKIEVKSAKRIKRADDIPNFELIWVELSNISAKEGRNGWLYGDADFVAFEQKDHFVLIGRKVLAEFVEQKCDLDTFVKTPKDALYKSYRRWDRPTEHLSIVLMKDILSLDKHKIIKKLGPYPKNSYFLRGEEDSGLVVELPDYKFDMDFEKIRGIRDTALSETKLKKIWIVKQD